MQLLRNAFAAKRPQNAPGFDPSYGNVQAAQRRDALVHAAADATRPVDQFQGASRGGVAGQASTGAATAAAAEGIGQTQTGAIEPMAWRLPEAPEQASPQSAPQGMDIIKGLVEVIAGLVGILGQLLKGRASPGQRLGEKQSQPSPTPTSANDRQEIIRARYESMQGRFSGRFGALSARGRTSRMYSAAGLASGTFSTSKGGSKTSLLDKVKGKTQGKATSAKESIGGRIKSARKKSGNNSPLALDINGQKGIQTSDKKVNFDIDGDGKLDQVNDVKEGVLAFGAGKNGKQLFGNNTDLDGDGKADGYKNGFEALRALAKKEGLYDERAGDTKLDASDIAALEQKYSFGLKQGYNGQTESLARHGVTEIELGSENARTTMRQGAQKDVTLQEQVGATFQHNGETKEYVDVWHRT